MCHTGVLLSKILNKEARAVSLVLQRAVVRAQTSPLVPMRSRRKQQSDRRGFRGESVLVAAAPRSSQDESNQGRCFDPAQVLDGAHASHCGYPRKSECGRKIWEWFRSGVILRGANAYPRPV